MPVIRLREFRYPDDYPAARSLWAGAGPGVQLGPSDEPDEVRKKLERDPDLFLAAESDGKLVGTVIGGFDGRRGMVYHLAVEPAFRQRGVGGLLMDELERRLSIKGCIRCYLLVTTENESAMQFYRQRGWAHLDSVCVFHKNLPQPAQD